MRHRTEWCADQAVHESLQGMNTDNKNKIKLILYPEIISETNYDEGGIGDPR